MKTITVPKEIKKVLEGMPVDYVSSGYDQVDGKVMLWIKSENKKFYIIGN